jgi:hypothetical protein
VHEQDIRGEIGLVVARRHEVRDALSQYVARFNAGLKAARIEMRRSVFNGLSGSFAHNYFWGIGSFDRVRLKGAASFLNTDGVGNSRMEPCLFSNFPGSYAHILLFQKFRDRQPVVHEPERKGFGSQSVAEAVTEELARPWAVTGQGFDAVGTGSGDALFAEDAAGGYGLRFHPVLYCIRS